MADIDEGEPAEPREGGGKGAKDSQDESQGGKQAEDGDETKGGIGRADDPSERGEGKERGWRAGDFHDAVEKVLGGENAVGSDESGDLEVK